LNRRFVRRELPFSAAPLHSTGFPEPSKTSNMIKFRAFEDFKPGEIIPLGEKLVIKEEVIEFASEFDAQPFHLDEDAGKASLLGGLAASGWHTAVMVMRMFVDSVLVNSTCQGAPGVEELNWKKPVYPEDLIAAEAEVVSTRYLNSKPGYGLVKFRFAVRNQNGEIVMDQENSVLFTCRETGQ